MGYIETMANVSVLAHDEPVSDECLAPLQKGLRSVGCARKGQTAAAAVSIIRGGIVGASRIKNRGRPSIEDTNVPFSPAAPRLRGDRIVPEAWGPLQCEREGCRCDLHLQSEELVRHSA